MPLAALRGLREQLRASVQRGAQAAHDRVLLARLEWAQVRLQIAWLVLLTIGVCSLVVVALLLLAAAIAAPYWDTPDRTTVLWWLVAAALLLCGLGGFLLVRVLQRLGRPFALTRHELAQDWDTFKEGL